MKGISIIINNLQEEELLKVRKESIRDNSKMD